MLEVTWNQKSSKRTKGTLMNLSITYGTPAIDCARNYFAVFLVGSDGTSATRQGNIAEKIEPRLARSCPPKLELLQQTMNV